MNIATIGTIAVKLLLNLAGASLMAQSVLSFLPAGKGWVRRVIPYLLFIITINNKSWIGDENPLILFPFFILAFLLCYAGPWYARLVTGIIFYILLEPLCMLGDTIDLYSFLHFPYEILIAVFKSILWVLVWLLIRKIRPVKEPLHLPGRLWALLGGLSLAPMFTVLSFSIWKPGSFDYDAYHLTVRRLGYTVLPFVVLSALALLVALVVLARHEELEAARRLSEVQATYYQSLQREQAGVRTLKHDLHNHIATARHLLAEDKPDEAARYLAQLSASPALAGSVQICENEVANAVLCDKAAIMKQNGLTADWEVSLPGQLAIPDTELCALLGNALDNAIEAAQNAQDKCILLRARADKGVLMLRVENALNAPLQRQGHLFKTTKADTKTHGLGLAGMQSIAQRHGGTMEVTAENDRFELMVFLPLAPPA